MRIKILSSDTTFSKRSYYAANSEVNKVLKVSEISGLAHYPALMELRGKLFLRVYTGLSYKRDQFKNFPVALVTAKLREENGVMYDVFEFDEAPVLALLQEIKNRIQESNQANLARQAKEQAVKEAMVANLPAGFVPNSAATRELPLVAQIYGNSIDGTLLGKRVKLIWNRFPNRGWEVEIKELLPLETALTLLKS